MSSALAPIRSSLGDRVRQVQSAHDLPLGVQHDGVVGEVKVVRPHSQQVWRFEGAGDSVVMQPWLFPVVGQALLPGETGVQGEEPVLKVSGFCNQKMTSLSLCACERASSERKKDRQVQIVRVNNYSVFYALLNTQ